jgi:hypothetical protein
VLVRIYSMLKWEVNPHHSKRRSVHAKMVVDRRELAFTTKA